MLVVCAKHCSEAAAIIIKADAHILRLFILIAHLLYLDSQNNGKCNYLFKQIHVDRL